MEIPVDFFEDLHVLVVTWQIVGILLILCIGLFLMFKFFNWAIAPSIGEQEQLKKDLKKEIKSDLDCGKNCIYLQDKFNQIKKDMRNNDGRKEN